MVATKYNTLFKNSNKTHTHTPEGDIKLFCMSPHDGASCVEEHMTSFLCLKKRTEQRSR